MIEFVCGRAGCGKSTYILEKLRCALSQIENPLANPKRLYLIVPEQQAVVWESRAARALPTQAALSLEIVNFTRLCNLFCRTYGGITERAITRGGKAALMWSTLRSLSDALHMYGGNTRPERVTPTLLSAVSEMKRNGVTPAMLAEAADRLSAEDEEENRLLAARAMELAQISAAYQHLLEERYTDDEDALSHLAERLKSEPFFAGADVFVDSFFSLTPVENEILGHIFRQADNVTVSFSCPAQDTGEAQFAAPRSFLTAMRQAADRVHRPYTITALTENRRAETAALAYLEDNLWRFDAAPYAESSDAIRLIYARDRYAEADAAVSCVQSLLRSGARCAEIALIARDAEQLRGILDTAFQRAGIPCFFSERADVPSRPAARLIFAALSAVGSGFLREDVILCAKTGLCGLSDDECDALELYTETWHIRGARSFESAWNMNPDGYTAEMSQRGIELLQAANTAREKLLPPLLRFAEVFSGGSARVPEIGRAVYELLCEYGVWDALRDSADRLTAAGRGREAAEEAQLWDILMDALDTLAEVLPDAYADAAAFASLLRQVLGTVRVGAIPSGIDEIVIGSADQVRLGEISHVILLGAVDGEFPGSPIEDGFFSDTDKIRLEGEGITLSATSDDRMKEELFWFYRAAALARRSLTVLIPQTNAGVQMTPSIAVERIRTLFSGKPIENYAAWGADRTIFTKADAADHAISLAHTAEGEALLHLGALPHRRTAAIPLSGKNEKISPETAELLFPRNIPLTQSRLDAFVLCRFGYYCRYVVKLAEKKEASLTAINVGTFLHRVLELFFTRTEGEPLPLSEEQMTAVTDEILSTVVSEICPSDVQNGRATYLFTRLKRCVLPMLRSLSDEFAQSAFRPVRFELAIGTGEPDALPAWSIPTGDGHNVRLRGTIDRLDAWRDGDDTYIRVVDYKTGSKKFMAEDITIGVNMQLLLYLFSVLHCPEGDFRESLTGKRNGILRAAGALYFSARPGTSIADNLISPEEAEKQVRADIDRSGVLLSDERVLRAMEPDLGGEFLPVTKRKNSVVVKAAVTEERLTEMEQQMQETIARIGREMCSGGAEAMPLVLHGQDPCEWCAMRAICRIRGAVMPWEITAEPGAETGGEES